MQEAAITFVVNQCTICKGHIDPWDRSFIVVRMPSLESHALCTECWLTVMSSSYAWLTAEGDDAPDAVRRRIRAALALFADKKVSGVIPGQKGPSGSS
jgi:hypothetical protein